MKQRIYIYLPCAVIDELDALARERDETRGEVIQRLVIEAREVKQMLKSLETSQTGKDPLRGDSAPVEIEVSDQDVADCMDKAMEKLPVDPPRLGPSDERIDSAEKPRS